MGMSSSQARLLNLTARMHQIEYKAAKVEAQKLQMANESRRVYDNYLHALEAQKIQYKAMNADGSISYKDATLKSLENGIVDTYTGEKSGTTVYLQNIETKRIMLTSEVADKFGLNGGVETRDMDTYIYETTGLDKTIPVGFSKVANTPVNYPIHERAHIINPVRNEDGVVDESKLANFASFNSAHTANVSDSVALSSVSSITANSKYTISTKEELQKLMTLSQTSTLPSATYTLTRNIDLNGINWSGIKNFKGTFDGNGYVISNLTGSQGLFQNTQNATIKNVGLENVNINGNSAYVGGLVGKLDTDSNNSSSVINCYSKGSVKNTNNTTLEYDDYDDVNAGTGGLIGHIYTNEGANVTVKNAYSRADVTGINGVGGFLGTSSEYYNDCMLTVDGIYATGNVTGINSVGGFAGFMYNDQDNSNSSYSYGDTNARYTGLSNIYAGGNVTATGEKSGGFIGCYLYWGDNEDFCRIYNCNATGSINGNTESSAFIGSLYMKNYNASDTTGYYLVHFEDCGFIKEDADTQPFGNIYNLDNYASITELSDTEIQKFKDVSTTGSGFASLINPNQIPTAQDFGLNIIAAITKTDAVDFDYCKEDNTSKYALATKISAFLSKFSNADNEKLYFLNQALCEYLDGTNTNDQIAIDLYNDVISNSTENTKKYYEGKSLNGLRVVRATSNTATADSVIIDKHVDADGHLTIPSRNDLATQLYASLKLSGKTINEVDVKNWINSYSASSTQDMLTLANINNIIQSGDSNKLNNIYSAITSTNKIQLSDDYNLADWVITCDTSDKSSITYDWDTTNPAIANAITMWTLSQRGVEVVDDEQAESTIWLANIVNDGGAVLTTFSPEKLAALPIADVLAMSDDEYYQALDVINTSVSTNTSLQEVNDEVMLKKVEAQYEADMKRIDLKDRKYDTELAALDTERNAIKQEIETLKTVARENVERTFKLFG